MNASTHPTISVVIPTYNLEAEVGQTLSSVLAQTRPPDEVLIVDDGSTDATRDRVNEMVSQAPPVSVRLISAPHAGPGATRNRGVAEARGDWVAFLDGDDLWEPAKIEELEQAIRDCPAATMIAHDNYERTLDGAVTHNRFHQHYNPQLPLLPQLYRINFIATSCVAVRVDVLRASGGFDAALGAGQDYDLWLTLARDAQLVFIQKPLETYVHRAGNLSTRWLTRYRCVLTIAYRHAPYLVPVVGWRRAFLLRFRLVLIAHHYVLTQRPWSNAAEYLQVLINTPWQLALAALRPL